MQLAMLTQRFTSKEYDNETQFDYFGARYFSGPQGRFTSSDEPLIGQDLSDPQSWNLYSYGLNNPLRFTDPDGHDPDPCGNNPNCVTVTAKQQGLSYIEEMLFRGLINAAATTLQVGQQTQQLVQPVVEFVSQPRNTGCMATFDGGGVRYWRVAWGGGRSCGRSVGGSHGARRVRPSRGP
jgi:RHS repeat-associated protein